MISTADLTAISPEIIVVCSAMAVLLLGLFVKKEWRFLLGYLSVAGVVAAAFQSWAMRSEVHSAFFGMFILDGYATYFKMVFYVAASIALLISISFVKTEKIERGEYYSLMLFATAGMMVMASGSDLISIYLGIELMALSIYILAGFHQEVPALQRGRAEVLPAGGVLLGYPALRHSVDIRHHRHHELTGISRRSSRRGLSASPRSSSP